MWLLRLHVLPTPSPVRLSVPGGSAPSAVAAPLPQELPYHQIETSSSKLSVISPEVGGCLQQHTQTGHTASDLPLFLLGGLTSTLWAGVPSMDSVTWPCVGSPASTRAVAAILLLATLSPSSQLLGWQTGMEPPPRLWKSRFSLCPWEAPRWRGEDGAFPFVGLLQGQGRAAQPFGTCTGEGQPVCPGQSACP